MRTFKYIAVAIGLMAAIGVANLISTQWGEAKQVAQQEMGAKAAYRKYDWFKRAANELDAKQADLSAMQAKVDKRCGDTMKDKMIDTCNIWEQEQFGLKASYNGLVAEYNAASDNFTWTLFNAETDRPPLRFERR